MTATPLKPSASASESMPSPRAFAAIALAAVSWDGMLSKAGSRALRHALDYREPYRHLEDSDMVEMTNGLLADLRHKGAQHLMVEAAVALSPSQRATAYAVAAEIMRSEGRCRPMNATSRPTWPERWSSRPNSRQRPRQGRPQG